MGDLSGYCQDREDRSKLVKDVSLRKTQGRVGFLFVWRPWVSWGLQVVLAVKGLTACGAWQPGQPGHNSHSTWFHLETLPNF